MSWSEGKAASEDSFKTFRKVQDDFVITAKGSYSKELQIFKLKCIDILLFIFKAWRWQHHDVTGCPGILVKVESKMNAAK